MHVSRLRRFWAPTIGFMSNESAQAQPKSLEQLARDVAETKAALEKASAEKDETAKIASEYAKAEAEAQTAHTAAKHALMQATQNF
jgi:hypothetical protein